MNKDYMPSKKYTQEEITRYGVPYVFNDSCVDEYMDYIKCQKSHMGIIENKVIYKLPFSSSMTNCYNFNEIWTQCQEKREREIFEQMRKIYKESYKNY